MYLTQLIEEGPRMKTVVCTVALLLLTGLIDNAVDMFLSLEVTE